MAADSGVLSTRAPEVATRTTNKRSADETDLSARAAPAKRVFPIFSKSAEEPESAGPFRWRKPAFLPSTCLHGENLNLKIHSKIAAFDLDGTVIKFLPAKGEFEWEFWHSSMPRFLKDAQDSGFTIVFFSNQLYPEKKLVKWREKIGYIAKALHEVPFLLFASTSRDGYRKPMPGMWVALERMAGEAGITLDKKNSFFVGDAAGRKGDHASTDRKFADNVGLKFYTPEEYFLKESPRPYRYAGDAIGKLHFPNGPRITPTSSPIIPTDRSKPELVLFVGYPASGKTTLFKDVFLPVGYVHVNQDTLGTRPKCLKAAEESLRQGLSCVIDNTNRDKKTRQLYITLAKSLGVPIRCFVFNVSKEVAWHNNLYRAFCEPLLSGLKAIETKERRLIPRTAFSQGYEQPEVDEGFDEVKTVRFRFEGDADKERFWRMWLHIDGK